jgi:hypothetical protein
LSYRYPDRGAAAGYSRGDRDWEFDRLSQCAEACRHLRCHSETADAKCLSAYCAALDARHRADEQVLNSFNAFEVLPTNKVDELLTL